MKYTIIYILALAMIGLMGCNHEQKGNMSTDVIKNPKTASGNEIDDLPVLHFEDEVYDFGQVIQGEKVTYNFVFKNTGKSDLVISQVHSSCGCTVPDFPKEPIKPGEKGKIKVTFDSSGRKGIQNKTVTIVSNCQPNKSVIRIKAMVLEP